MYRYIWLVPLLPLAGAAVNGLLGRKFRFSEKLIGGIAAGSIALAFLISVAAVYSYAFSNNALWPQTYVTSQDGAFSFDWIPGGAVRQTLGSDERASAKGTEEAAKKRAELPPERQGEPVLVAVTAVPRSSVLNVEWSYQLDALSSIFMLVVTGVGLCIFVFATGYMHGDPGFYRFFAYMGLFMFSMLVLVMGSNFLMMFVGWEGVGLCSYLLIGYYFDRQEAANASRKAFITNRIGDFGFALAIFGVIATFGTAQYSDVFAQARNFPLEPLGHWGLLSWIALGLFIGACGKSAQLPLHVWLPDAMAGPTPVSALIHAATMVTAGLYMVTRTNVIFQHSQTMMLVVAVVGAATALFAATIGITQNDIKKVLAYSTVSQLGFMFMACGVGAFAIGIFHVMTHAFFKALMFLGAGSVIHGMHHEQDMRRMGGLRKYMPYTYWTFLAGWLAICGIIPFSGFWSKDEILWNAAATRHIPIGWLVWIVGTIAATCTAFYMTRLVAMTFWGKEKFLGPQHAHSPEHEVHNEEHPTPQHHTHIPHESPRSMWVPLAVLAVLATIGGFVGISTAFTGGKHVGGRMNIVNFLDPIIWNPTTGYFGTHESVDSYGKPLEQVAESHAEVTATEHEPVETPPPYGEEGFNLAHAVESKIHSEWLTEVLFILISLLVAGIGIGLGLLFYVKDTRLPDIWAARLRPLYQASYNKYWVDEFFGLTVTRRVMDAARGVFAFDSKVVDGAVNGSAWLTKLSSRITGGTDQYFVDGLVNAVAAFIMRLMSPLFRAAQTGLTQNYALVMVVGLVAAVALFFGADILQAFKEFLRWEFDGQTMKSLHILSIVTWLPTLGAIIILALFKKDQAALIKKFATAWFGLAFIASLVLLAYDRVVGGMQFLEDHEWIPVIGARYQMGVDGVAILLIVLTTLLGVIAALSSWNYIQKREKEYYVLLLLLQTAVVGVFTSMDLFLFYLFFEVSLVPMYFLIGIWGGENRLYAAIKFFLYTLVGSVVMLLGVLKIYFLTQDTALTGQITQATVDMLAGNKEAAEMVARSVDLAARQGTGTFNILHMQALGSVLPMGAMQVLLFFAFALGFAIKVPMFPFHTWLPDAHVEAPTAGSVILAGILLKLGTYGFFRFNIPMFPAASADEAFFGSFGVRSVMIFLAIVGIIYGALAAMYFVVKKDGDVKKLVAYSSVSSMGIVMLGLFALNPNGVNGAVLHMINHGIYSAALFLLVGIIYERRHTRNVAEFGGLSHVMPGYATVFLAMAMTAIGLPLLCVFISEFLSLRGAFEANPVWAAWGALGIILNAAYMLWLYQRMFFGTIDNPKNEKLTDLNGREWAYMMPLVILSLWIGVYPKPFLNYIARPVNAVVRHVRPAYPIPGMPLASQNPQQATAVSPK